MDDKAGINTDAEISITLDGWNEEGVYALVYGEPLWPDVISDDDNRING